MRSQAGTDASAALTVKALEIDGDRTFLSLWSPHDLLWPGADCLIETHRLGVLRVYVDRIDMERSIRVHVTGECQCPVVG